MPRRSSRPPPTPTSPSRGLSDPRSTDRGPFSGRYLLGRSSDERGQGFGLQIGSEEEALDAVAGELSEMFELTVLLHSHRHDEEVQLVGEIDRRTHDHVVDELG